MATKHKTLKKIETKKDANKKKVQKIGLYAQIFFTLIAIVLAVISMFKKEFIIFLEMAVALDMFAMALNNQLTYKRRLLTFFYIGVGLVMIFLIIRNLVM